MAPSPLDNSSLLGTAFTAAITELVRGVIRSTLGEELTLAMQAAAGVHDNSGAESSKSAISAFPLSECAWTVKQVAQYLAQSVSEVRKLERSGILPALPRYNHRLTFDPEVVRRFRATGSVKVVELKKRGA